MYSFLIFWITFILGDFYISGDQVHYAKAYTEIHKLPLFEAYRTYRSILSSGELTHFIFIWSFGGYFEKNIVMPFWHIM